MIVPLTGLVLPALVFALMVIVGTELRRRDFETVARRPRSLLVGTLAQAIIGPAVALATIAVLQPGPVPAAALALLSVCPSGALSNLYTFIARGNVALSICLTTASSLFAILVTPALAIALFTAILDTGAPLSVPLSTILAQLGLFVLAPVVIGMAIGYRFPGLLEANRKTFMAAAFAFLSATLAIAIAESWHDLVDSFWTVGALALVFTIGTLMAGRVGALLVHPGDGNRMRRPQHPDCPASGP